MPAADYNKTRLKNSKPRTPPKCSQRPARPGCCSDSFPSHLGRIFKSGELEADTVVKEILITAQSDVRGTSDEKIRYYNLDAIISIGYRVNSILATKFRIWATSVIKLCYDDKDE